MALRYWTEEEEKSLKQMALKGASLSDISKALDRTPMAILLRTRTLSGLERPDAKRRMSTDYYNQTKTIREVAVNFGAKWTKSENEKLMHKFKQGANIYEIAELMDRSPQAIISQIEKISSDYGGLNALFDYAKSFFKFKKI